MRFDQVLLLNMNYAPISIISWKRAVDLIMFRGKAEPLVEYEERKSDFLNPAVVRLLVKTPDPFKLRQNLKFSKRNVLLRDQYKCVYCGDECTDRNATIDHVIPKSRGGTSTYTNCVTSCRKCNSFKDDRTPEEAGMTIRSYHSSYKFGKFYVGEHSIPREWKYYMSRA